MSAFAFAEALKDDGRRFVCYKTEKVHCLEDGRLGPAIGMVQCEGPCWGLSASRNHQHGPWIAFVGNSSERSLNLAGTYPTKLEAAAAIKEKVG